MNKNAKYWFLENFDFMKKLGKNDLMKLSDSLEMVYLKKGDLIQYSQKPDQLVIFLKKGSVKIVNRSTEAVKYIIGEGNVFGVLNLNENNIDPVSEEVAICLEETMICYIPKEEMRSILKEYPSLKNSIIKIQSLRINRLESRLSDLLYKSSNLRIKEFIYSFAKNYGQKNGKIIHVKNTLTHKDIAHLTNTSRQTVNNVISKMRKQGEIEYSRKEITILIDFGA